MHNTFLKLIDLSECGNLGKPGINEIYGHFNKVIGP